MSAKYCAAPKTVIPSTIRPAPKENWYPITLGALTILAVAACSILGTLMVVKGV